MQPILNIVKRPTIRRGAQFMMERPDVAVRIAAAIGSFSEVEATIASLFTNLLGKNLELASELFMEQGGATGKGASLDAIAAKSLSKSEHAAFVAVMTCVEAAQKTRDKYAHWVWGVCEELEDGLALIDPKIVEKYRIKILGMRQRRNVTGAVFDQSKYYAVRTSDLDRTIQANQSLAVLVFEVARLAADRKGPRRAQRLREILRHEHLTAVLSPDNNSRPERRASRPSPRRKGRRG